jgi:ABC-type transporter Mla MlaB component
LTRHDPARKPIPRSASVDQEHGVVVLAGPLDPEALATLTSQVEGVLADRDVHVVVCDVESYPAADLRLVEALARLALTAKRLGRRIRVRHASPEVRSFLAFAGLAEVLPCEDGRRGPRARSVEVRR